MNKILYSLVINLLIFFLFPGYVSANGGDQRVIEGKYLINLSRSPFTPKAGQKVSMIASFVDIQTDKLISEDLIASIRIAKLGEGRGDRSFLFEQKDTRIKGGVLEFEYTFADSGLHEIFFGFAFASNPQKIYNAPDFLMDVQKADVGGKPQQVSSTGVIFNIVIGIVSLAVGYLLGYRRQAKNKALSLNV